jgi:nitronate monooxygenase
VITRALSGRPARGIANRITRDLADLRPPAYPVMNSMTRPLRRAAAGAGSADVLALWAGQGVPATRELGAAELVARLEREADQVIGRLADLWLQDGPERAASGC